MYSVENNSVGDKGAIATAALIMNNHTQTSLNFGMSELDIVENNGIGDAGAIAIAAATEGNDTLSSPNFGKF